MNKVFSITTPLSNYLQSPTNDFIESLAMVDLAEKRLKELRTIEALDDILKEAKEFSISNGLEEIHFPQVRSRKRKRMDDELVNNELIEDRLFTSE